MPVLVALALVIVVVYEQDVHYQRSILAQQVNHMVDLQFALLNSQLRAVRSDLLYLARQNVLMRFLSGDKQARTELEHEYVQFALHKGVYDQIRVLDTAGEEIVRINYHNGHPRNVPQDQLQLKATRYYYRQALALSLGEVFVSPFDLNIEHGLIERPLKPVIRFLTPVFDSAGNKRGLLVLNYLGEHLLTQLAVVSSGSPGVTMLLNSSGDYLYAPDRADAWASMLGHERTFRRHFPAAWRTIQAGDAGEFLSAEGLFRFRQLRPADSLPQAGAPSDPDTAPANASDLVLVAHVPTRVLRDHSARLLRPLLILYAAASLFVVALAWYWARGRAQHEYQARQIADSETRLRKLSSQLLAAQETERRSVSRDLHDHVGQLITAVSLDLQLAARQTDWQRMRELVTRAIDECQQLLESVHEIASRVRPSVLDDLGLEDAVESCLAEFERRTGIHVHPCSRGGGAPLSPIIGENVYRILQEALSNVAKHAQASQVWVTMDRDDESLQLTVRDDGNGFRADQLESSRLGLLGMQERCELLEGRFQLVTAPGQGTEIRVCFPLVPHHA